MRREEYEAMMEEADRLEASALEKFKAVRAELIDLENARDKFINCELRGARWIAANKPAREEWERILERFHEGPKVV